MTVTLLDVFLSNRNSLIWSVMRIVRDWQAAEDVTQETFIRARQAMENGRIDQLEAYLHRTARNLAIDFRRHRELHGGVERDDISERDAANVATSAPSPEAELIQTQRLRLLDQSIKQLPERAQTVWYLNRVEKWSYPRIAEHLGVSANTVFNDFKLAHGHCIAAMAKIDLS